MNNADPYILVDGVEEGSINQIDANDIESISVLKDAAAAAIYGSKASNGVILITTKRGSEGKPVVSYNASVGFQSPTAKVERMDSWEAADFYNRALENSGKVLVLSRKILNYLKMVPTPMGILIQTGMILPTIQALYISTISVYQVEQKLFVT